MNLFMKLKTEFLYAAVFIFVLSFSATAQNKKMQTVLDYFLAVPSEYLGIAKHSEDRAKVVEKKDLKNSYLKLGGLWEGWGDAALFKNSDGSKTFAIQTIGCGPACGTESLFFLQYKNGKWIDVTAKILPKVSENELFRVMKCINPQTEESVITYYELPQIGTTVKLIDDNATGNQNKILYEFSWNGAKFTAKAKRNKACKAQ